MQLTKRVHELEQLATMTDAGPLGVAVVQLLAEVAGEVERMDRDGSTRLRSYIHERPAFALHDHELPEPDGLASSRERRARDRGEL